MTIDPDPTVQATVDSATIVNYLKDLGYEGDEVGTHEDGVRYVILDPGTGDAIDDSDIVTFNYTGMLLNDTIFDTSIKEVGDSIRLKVEENITPGDTTDIEFALLRSFKEDRTYTSTTFTYSSSGWTLISTNYIQGYKDGISATFNKMNVGGTSLIVIPSGLAYGTRGTGSFIEPNTVIAFKLYPTKVIKQ